MTEQIRCIIVDDEPVARDVLEEHLKKIDNVEVVCSCRNALEAYQAIHLYAIDLVFLDISMPEISGLSFARSVAGNTKIIFTTAFREYAVDGFELKAVDYLLKPISLERLLQALNKFFNERGVRAKGPDPHTEEPDNFLFIRSDRKMVKVFFHDILLVESLGDYLKIHLADRRILVTRDSLSVMESRMPYREFLKTHRSYLVALRWIDSYTSDTICIGKLEVPISRSHREEVLHRLGEY